MLKRTSSDALVKLTHDESSLETIQLKDKINILEDMINKPSKMKRQVFIASRLYDDKGNLNTDHLGYQLTGTLALTNIPISIILGAGLLGCLTHSMELTNGLLITGGTFFIGETIAFTGISAYMTSKGSKMADEMKNKLTIDLEKNGYQVSLPESKEKIDFDTLILSLIGKLSVNQYPGYEEDFNKIKSLYSRWLDKKSESLATTGTKIPVPKELQNEYLNLYQEIHHKIKMFRYEDNNSKLLTQERIGGLNTPYIKLVEEDPYILEISSLIEKILSSNYEGFADDIETLRTIATNWIAENIKSYRDNGYRLDDSKFPHQELTAIKEKLQSIKSLKKKQ